MAAPVGADIQLTTDAAELTCFTYPRPRPLTQVIRPNRPIEPQQYGTRDADNARHKNLGDEAVVRRPASQIGMAKASVTAAGDLIGDRSREQGRAEKKIWY